MKETIFVALVICIMITGLICLRVVQAQYQTNITINSDGNVIPSTAPIQQVGGTYILTSNVSATITIQRSNAVFDGNGYTITGDGPMATITAYAMVYGLLLNQVSNVTVKNFIISNCSTGIELDNTSNVTITNNTIAESAAVPIGLEPTAGIAVDGSSNVIAGNNFVNDRVGISLISLEPGKCVHNQIVENNFTGCSSVFLFYNSSSNTIYHNNFLNDSNLLDDGGYGAFSTVSLNTWDDGYPSGGNYWSDYLTKYPNATEKDSSGIGNTPYFVKPSTFIDPSSVTTTEARNYWISLNALYLNNTDRYPLMEPFTTTPKISLLSPMDIKYKESSVSLVFTIDRALNWVGYDLDGQKTVTITGNTTIVNLTSGLHSITVYANDTFGNLGASQTTSFTIAKTQLFPIVTVAVVSGAVAAVVVGAGLIVYFKKYKRQA